MATYNVSVDWSFQFVVFFSAMSSKQTEVSDIDFHTYSCSCLAVFTRGYFRGYLPRGHIR